MSISLVQDEVESTIFSATVAKLFGLPTSSGNLITVSLRWDDGAKTVLSVVDTAGNTYAPAHPVQKNNAGDRSRQLWYAYNCTGHATNTVTATLSASNGWLYIDMQEWTGLSGGGDPLVDYVLTATLSTADPYDYDLGTVTPTNAGDLVLIAQHIAGAVGVDVPPVDSVTPPAASQATLNYYYIATAASAYHATFSLVDDSEVYGVTALFKADTASWVPIADFETPLIDAVRFANGTGRVTCDLWTEALGGSPLPTITARLVSLLTTRGADGQLEMDAEVGRSATLSSDVPADGSFGVTLTGIKRHRLEVTSDTPEIDLFCAPGAEVTP